MFFLTTAMSIPLVDMVGAHMQPAGWLVPVDYQYKSIFARTVFSFTMRRAACTGWGLVFDADENDKTLEIKSVVGGGAIDAWNKMGVSMHKTDRLVLPGDKIIRVNGVTDDTSRMATEIRNKLLLTFTIVRTEMKMLPVCMPLVPMPSISE